MLDRFLSEIRIGDLVVTPDGEKVYFGEIQSEPEWVAPAEPGAARRRRVLWLNPDRPARRKDLSVELLRQLRTRLTVTSLGDCGDVLRRLAQEAV